MAEYVEYKVGDRIHCYHDDLISQVRGKYATVTKIDGDYVSALVDDVKNPSSVGYNFSRKHIKLVETEPTEEEIAALFNLKRDVHFLHAEARDLDFEGCSALCDWMNCLDEAPRVATESSRIPEDVTCQDCLNFMSRLAYVWIDGGADHYDYHHGATDNVPQNPYWGDGS